MDEYNEYMRLSIAAEVERLQQVEQVSDRAALIVRMLLGGNDAARAQAERSIERMCWAEETLAAIRRMPNRHDLMTNALARAMYEVASRREAS